MCLGLTCCIGSALCCAGACCCNLLCAPCRKCGINSKNFARIAYLVFMGVMICMAMLLMWVGSLVFEWTDWTGILKCPNQSTSSSKACLGADSLVRMSFCLAIFHLIMICTILPRGDGSA